MLFTSPEFLVLFLPATVALYWLVPARARVVFLLLASYVFYMSWNPVYGFLLAGSTAVNYVLARRIPGAANPKVLLACGVIFNLGMLSVFKYAGLFTSGAADLADFLGVASSGGYDGLRILLPLGISFFTFEMISVLVDVYRGSVRIGGFLVFAAYKSFFPKVLSGPITRYSELAPQLERTNKLRFDQFQSGLGLIALGLAKKLALANNLAIVVDAVYANPSSISAAGALTAILAFGFQIYFDFSGYIDIGRGTARLFGLELPRNFNFPYAATSPSDFWRRWNISLSRFLRDYLYIPLGGNRGGTLLTYRNLMITMVLGGLWHGAGWQFALWGGLHGVLLCISHALRGRFESTRVTRTLGWAVTITAVFAIWVFFRAPSLDVAFDVFRGLFNFPGGFSVSSGIFGGIAFKYLLVAFVAALLVQRLALPVAAAVKAAMHSHRSLRHASLAFATIACLLVGFALAPLSAPPFIYFRF
jgi:D-alanyl-lipoteichoic acid acyltransferase DltB (MBOAT superfamily)